MILGYKEVVTGINEIKNSVKGLKTQLDQIGNNTGISKLNKQIKQTSGFSKTLKGIAGLGTAVVTGRKMIKVLQGMTEESVNFVETQNLFNVSMGKGLEGLNQYYEKAVKFQNELEEKLGVNIEESMNYQALFNSMSKSMGISAKYAYILSENFTKLGYDLASLYNIDPESAMEKLRAGLAGQTKPLRDLGLDITQQSLQPIADELGIETSIKNMSQAEKMILRYIAVLKQAQIAQGDFANTMETPANQLRIFNAQITAFKRNMGNLWQGFLGGILPYINGIMMVVNELLKMVAKLFGFKVSDQTASISASVGVDDLSDDLGTASGKAKELKNQLMGFDEINNISLQNDTGSGSSSTSVGGIDQRLLDAMSEYDNLMDSVSGKATEIRDKIMEWLGFTKKINPLTGEISWEYTGMSKKAKVVLGILKGIVGLYVGTKVLKFIGYLKTLKGVLTGVIAPTTSFQTGLASLGKGAKATWTVFKLGVEQFKLYRQAGDSVTTSLGKTTSSLYSLIPTTVKATAGIAGLVGSCSLAYKSMEDLSEGSIGSTEAILKLSGGLAGATASGALLGSVIPGVGTVIGAVTGFLIGGISALAGYKTEEEKLTEEILEGVKAREEYRNSIQETRDLIEETVNNQLAEVEYTKKLVAELDNLVDANGKVKEGYEARASYILNELNEAYGTEYELVDGVIEGYDKLKDTIYDVIEAKKAEIILEANQENYAQAIQHRAKLYADLEEATKDASTAEEAYKEELKLWGLTLEDAENCSVKYLQQIDNMGFIARKQLSKLGETYKETKKDLKEASKAYEENNKSIIYWEDLKTATIEGDQEKISKAVKQITNTYKTEAGNQQLTLTQQLKEEKAFYKQRLEELKKNGIEITEEIEETYSSAYNTIVESLIKETEAVEELTPEQVKAWKTLAKQSHEKYVEGLSGLDTDTQRAIQKATGVIASEISVATPKITTKAQNIKNILLQNLGTDFSLKPTIKIKPSVSINTTGATTAIKTFNSGITTYLENRQAGYSTLASMNNKVYSAYAEGGFPVTGEMFIARENGIPEMVGKIGNKTSVANNMQIIEGIKEGVYEAVVNANAQNNGSKVALDIRADEGIIVKKASKGFKEFVEQTGELPFPVPV